MTAEQLGTEQLRLDIVNEFDAMHQDVTETLRENMDRKLLGLRSDQIFEDDEKESAGSKSKDLVKILLKWDALGDGGTVGDSTSECSHFHKCPSLKRLVFVMEIFAQNAIGRFVGDVDHGNNTDFIDIIHCLSGYDEIAMLNDLEHVRDHNENLPSMECVHDDDDAECIGEMMRQYRGNNGDDLMNGTLTEYLDRLSLKEKSILNTCSRIHSFLYHQNHRDDTEQVDDDGNEDDVNLKRPRRPREQKEMTSKFVNEIETEKATENVEAKRMDTLFADLENNGPSQWKAATFMAELFDQQYDSEAIIQDLVDDENDPLNHYEDSNLFPLIQWNPFLAKNIRKHFNVKGNDDDQLQEFSFGKNRLYHWKGTNWRPFDKRPGYVGGPRYGSLKEECLNNGIHQMTIREFSEMLYCAFMFQQCAKARAFKATYHAADNKVYDVPADSPLSVCYIFVLLMYCNLTDLQYKYKKIGCRERDTRQTLEELIKSNREIAIWHRLIFEAVHFFGDLASPQQVYYTGLNAKLSFPNFAPVFNCPISTTGLILYLFVPFLFAYCLVVQYMDSEHRYCQRFLWRRWSDIAVETGFWSI